MDFIKKLVVALAMGAGAVLVLRRALGQPPPDGPPQKGDIAIVAPSVTASGFEIQYSLTYLNLRTDIPITVDIVIDDGIEQVTSRVTLPPGQSTPASGVFIVSSPGTYTITLRALDSQGNNLVEPQTLSIDVTGGPPPPPSVALTVNPLIGDAPLTVTYDLAISGGTLPLSIVVNFSDGQQSTEPSGSHTYLQAGSYVINVEVRDADQRLAIGSASITVTAPPPPPPPPPPPLLTITASGFPLSGPAPLTVGFSAVVAGGVPPYTFLWDFGDGSPTSNLQNPSHSYPAGTYTATVAVTDSA